MRAAFALFIVVAVVAAIGTVMIATSGNNAGVSDGDCGPGAVCANQ